MLAATPATPAGQARALPAQRKTLRCRTELRFTGSAAGNCTTVRSVDIWDAGMTVISATPLPTDALCTAIFYIPTNGILQIITAAAKILYCSCGSVEGWRIGVRFRHDDAHRSQLIDSLR